MTDVVKLKTLSGERTQDWIVLTTVIVENTTRDEALKAAQQPGVSPAAIVKVLPITSSYLAIRKIHEMMDATLPGAEHYMED